MNRDEILAMQPGRELDALVTREIIFRNDKDNPKSQRVLSSAAEWCPHHSSDIEAAWKIINHIRVHWLFSDRREFFVELDEAVKFRTGVQIDWPEALMFLEPIHICRAALSAILKGGNEAS